MIMVPAASMMVGASLWRLRDSVPLVCVKVASSMSSTAPRRHDAESIEGDGLRRASPGSAAVALGSARATAADASTTTLCGSIASDAATIGTCSSSCTSAARATASSWLSSSSSSSLSV